MQHVGNDSARDVPWTLRRALCSGDVTVQRMDNVLIVVDDLEAAKAFFIELDLELEGEAPVDGRWVDSVLGLCGIRDV